MAMLNAPTMECERVNLRRSVKLPSIIVDGELVFTSMPKNSARATALKAVFFTTKNVRWRYPVAMSPFAYHCPNTGFRVQSYDPVKTSDGVYDVVMCVMCGEVHLVKLLTGKVLGQDNK